MRHLATAKLSGFLDFKTNIIFLTKYKAENKNAIEKCLSHDPRIKRPESDAITDLQIKSLVVHEVTHFLDFTTTMWGIEFILRKMALVDLIQAEQDYDAKLRVFMLNLAELDMHKELIVFTPDISLESCIFSHELKYTEQYGTLIMIYYSHGDKRCHEVPLSMLSILEANAFANEFLSILCDIDLIDDPTAKQHWHTVAQKQFDKYLYSPDHSEYTVILYLARIHFPELTLRELLIFVSTLTRFALDLGSMDMSMLSNLIFLTFINERLGDSISLDMKRGASRHLVVFKTILLMHGWLHNLKQSEKDNHITLLKCDAMLGIRSFWVNFGAVFYEINDFELEWSLKYINQSKSMIDKDIVRMSMDKNRALVQRTAPGTLQLNQLHVPDIILDDNSIVTMPNRMDIDVVNYYENNITLLNDLERICNAEKTSKFHIHPDAPQFFLK
jgi:hypothetical protein